MTLQSWRSDYGAFTRPSPNSTIYHDPWFKPSGGRPPEKVYRPTDYCQRDGHTNNPLQNRGPDSWRNPSNYGRSVRLSNVTAIRRTVGKWEYWDIPFLSQSGLNLFSQWPGWWNNTGPYCDVPTNIINQANVTALNRLRGENSAQVGAAIAEGRESLRMISSRTIQVLSAYRSLRRGDFASFLRTLGIRSKMRPVKSASSLWLEYQYGWKPLLGDIHSGYMAARETFRRDNLRIHATATASEDSEQSSRRSADGYTWDSTWKGSRKVKTRIDAKIHSPQLYLASQLGLTDPLSVAWELVPYSFIFDWFVPVGNMLSAATAHMGLRFVGGSYSYSCQLDVVHEQAVVPTTSVYQQYGRASMAKWCMQRVRLYDFPRPAPYVNYNPFKSETRIFNALALIGAR